MTVGFVIVQILPNILFPWGAIAAFRAIGRFTPIRTDRNVKNETGLAPQADLDDVWHVAARIMIQRHM